MAVTPESPDRHALLLRAWEATNTERELQGVLAAVAEVLTSAVPFDAVAIISFEGERHDLYAMHVVGVPHREGETLKELQERIVSGGYQLRPVPQRPVVPYGDQREFATPGFCYSCPDVMAKEVWFEHDVHLAQGGVRSYVSIPLLVRGKLIGASVYSRRDPVEFTPAETHLLIDVSSALAVATANALANEEIRKLRDQLEEENLALRTQLGQAPWFEDIVGDSPALRRLLAAVEHVAPTDATVLLSGETGSGKELVARAIHRRSPRAHGPLVKFNCAAVPHTLLASELFGHERGAFTGALDRRKGRFEQAHGGTLLLDEIGELPPEMQIMLLRVLQEREFERLGGNQTVRVDVRIVAATNRDLTVDVQAGRFRSDLYYRLNVFPIEVPALRDRREDIPALVAHFAARCGARMGRSITRVERRGMRLLEGYDWPGNVRELENVIERAMILSRGGTLRIPPEVMPRAAATGDVDRMLREQEREAIESALKASGGRVAGENGAAQRLGLAPSTLEFRIRRLGIDRYQHRRRAGPESGP